MPYPVSCVEAKQIRRHPTIYLHERRIPIMTSQERREARYQRRQARRRRNRQARSDGLGGLTGVFSYRNMFKYGKKCCNGVRWKGSTHNFELHLFSGTAKRRRRILDGKWRPGKTIRFPLRERGKVSDHRRTAHHGPTDPQGFHQGGAGAALLPQHDL